MRKLLYVLLINASAAAIAAPPVDWSQNNVSVNVSQGNSQEISVTLHAMQDLGDIFFRPTPEIASLITVIPDSVNNVLSGDSVALTIRFEAAPETPVGLFDGVIQARSVPSRRKGQGRTLATPLPIMVHVDENQTVDSVDTDGNGVWDYTDAYIESQFPGTENAATRSAAGQFARSIQGGLINADNTQLSLEFAADSDRAIECMVSLHPDPATATQIILDLEAAILNTLLRSRAYLMFSEQSAGQVFSSAPVSQRSTSCVAE